MRWWNNLIPVRLWQRRWLAVPERGAGHAPSLPISPVQNDRGALSLQYNTSLVYHDMGLFVFFAVNLCKSNHFEFKGSWRKLGFLLSSVQNPKPKSSVIMDHLWPLSSCSTAKVYATYKHRDKWWERRTRFYICVWNVRLLRSHTQGEGESGLFCFTQGAGEQFSPNIQYKVASTVWVNYPKLSESASL